MVQCCQKLDTILHKVLWKLKFLKICHCAISTWKISKAFCNIWCFGKNELALKTIIWLLSGPVEPTGLIIIWDLGSFEIIDSPLFNSFWGPSLRLMLVRENWPLHTSEIKLAALKKSRNIKFLTNIYDWNDVTDFFSLLCKNKTWTFTSCKNWTSKNAKNTFKI